MSLSELRRRGLVLYREILRLHQKKLPATMKELGDTYVRAEFRAHHGPNTTPPQYQQFMNAWFSYVQTLRSQKDDIGRDLHDIDIENLNDEQRGKLQQLRQEARKLKKT
eukprot:GILK01012096.1.p1 GENE.GILK01012096.1~~GILK01012096.1.p1  ORF type:complete len:109 (-),score=10.43 GILK01012096.1:102-428(-)